MAESEIMRDQQLWSRLLINLVGLTLASTTIAEAATTICPSLCHCSSNNRVQCKGQGLSGLDGLAASTVELVLSNNQIAQFDLASIHGFDRLKVLELSQNNIHSVIKSDNGQELNSFSELTVLDLSQNYLHVIHPFVFTGFPKLQTLNLSGNAIHTISEFAFSLPTLVSLDLAHNAMEELKDQLFGSLPSLSEINLGHNKLSRLNDGTFGLLTSLSLLDLSHNQIMKMEDNVLAGMNITYLDLGHNSFRKIPNLSLRKLIACQTLILDGNLFTALGSHDLRGVHAEFLSISHNDHLIRMDKDSVTNMSQLQTLTVNNNPKLTYVHPGAIANTDKLAALDLSRNNLFALEAELIDHLPGLRALFLSGNSFKCHCSLAWVGSSSKSRSKAKIEDLDDVLCNDSAVQVPVKQIQSLGPECEPYILPLFPLNETGTMGRNVSWMCKALGSPDMALMWRLPSRGVIVGNGECIDRVCVTDNTLTVMYLHPDDTGRYGCVVKNTFGQDQRDVQLTVKSENVRIFPITVASTFVTLSWNMSSAFSADRGFVLRAKSSEDLSVVHKQYEHIDVGLKMNSYTVNGLEAGHRYLFELCLRRDQYIIPISSLFLTTKNSDFQTELGIETDYVSLFAVAIVLTGLASACLGMSVARLIKLHSFYSKDGDSLSQREMITSPSDQSNMAFLGPAQGHVQTARLSSSSSFTQPATVQRNATASAAASTIRPQSVTVTTHDQSFLVDNEVASPVDEVMRHKLAIS